MGIPVMVMGESGCGKSTSLRNFNEGEIGVFNVANKPLPFRKKLSVVNTSNYGKIEDILRKNSLNAYVIDDSQYLMCFESFSNAKVTGYGKFTDMALHFKGLLDTVIYNTSPNTIVYFLQHTQTSEQGRTGAKTIGKMLDNQLTVEGLFSIVLHAKYVNGKYLFVTQTDGTDTAKSPMDMFDKEIENDLKMVDSKIREYWSLAPLSENESEGIKDEKN